MSTQQCLSSHPLLESQPHARVFPPNPARQQAPSRPQKEAQGPPRLPHASQHSRPACHTRRWPGGTRGGASGGMSGGASGGAGGGGSDGGRGGADGGRGGETVSSRACAASHASPTILAAHAGTGRRSTR